MLRHHLGDYAKDTAHLSMLETGAYRLLLDRYYGTEQGIPADQAHRIARAKRCRLLHCGVGVDDGRAVAAHGDRARPGGDGLGRRQGQVAGKVMDGVGEGDGASGVQRPGKRGAVDIRLNKGPIVELNRPAC